MASNEIRGLTQRGNRWAWQTWVPQDVREQLGIKKFQVTFPVSQKEEAERLAITAERAFRIRVQEARARIINELPPSPEPTPVVARVRLGRTMQEAADRWRKTTGLKPTTVDAYMTSVREFTRWFEPLEGTCTGASIMVRDVNAYVDHLMSRGKAVATINRELAGLKLVFKAGRFQDVNPFEGVKARMIIEGSKTTVRKLTDPEVRKLLQAETDGNSHMAILIAAHSGMRLGEIAALRCADIEQIGSGRVLDLMNLDVKTETSKRKVPIHPRVWEELEPWIAKLDPFDFILPREKVDKLGRRGSAISKRINKLIDHEIIKSRSVVEHSLRHSFISKMGEAGIDPMWRKQIVGHKGSDVHDRYSHIDFVEHLYVEIVKVDYSAPPPREDKRKLLADRIATIKARLARK
jgi:integrase